ncbi:GNAT family N-acetyltransferase [Streptomyces sp. MNP-20]|uniref:GNAT family N-acetyltransferase n=1 Tax=Streptomyces sp. MNP-20 TaxID=2721165 RepID=UPI001558326B|nr:GNAT family N-acetyltransferase [Streptomyces sp. MNP-20]
MTTQQDAARPAVPAPPSGAARPGGGAAPAPPHPLGPLRARLAYWWNNTPSPAGRAARRAADGLPGGAPALVSHTSADGVTIAYAGLPVGRTNILQLLEQQRARLGSPTTHRTAATVTRRDLAPGVRGDADLLVLGAEEHRLRRLPDLGTVTAPFRLHLVVDVPDTHEQLQQLISKRERWQFRRDQRRRGWALEEDPSPRALAFFYERLHTPTMRHRHGERSRTERFEVVRHAVLPRGTLFFLTEAGTRVAGALCHWSKDRRTLTTRLLGVLDGREEHYRSGAFKALYHHLLRWACEHGVPRVDFFGTEAFVSKGIFQWKRRLGARPELPANHFATKRVRIYPRRDTPAVRDFLVANPLLRIGPRGGPLTPVYFTDDARPPRLDLSARCPGLAAPETVHLDTFLAPVDLRRSRPSGGSA